MGIDMNEGLRAAAGTFSYFSESFMSGIHHGIIFLSLMLLLFASGLTRPKGRMFARAKVNDLFF